MERPTDAFKETHNITLSREDTLFGGLVSNLQVAELMASIAKNPGLSYFKVLEVVAETTAPLTPLEELLAKIPSQRAYSPKEFGSGGGDAAASAPKSSQSVTSEKPSTPIEKEPAKEVPVKHASSPYIAYEDLKPPTSPMPSAPKATPSQEDSKVISEEQTNNAVSSASVNEKSSPSQEVLITQPLSPYFVYEDFKPPTSPRPTPSGPKQIPSDASTLVEVASTLVEDVSQTSGGNDVVEAITSNVAEKVSPQKSTHSHSPYHVYEDFKPPSSPSPTPAGPKKISLEASALVEVVSQSSGGSDATASVCVSPQNSTHSHSPYHAYDDFKPPSSPSPSPPTTSLLSTPTAGNGSQPGTLSVNSTVKFSIEKA